MSIPQQLEYDRLLLQIEFYMNDNRAKLELAQHIQGLFSEQALSLIHADPKLAAQWETVRQQRDVILSDLIAEPTALVKEVPDVPDPLKDQTKEVYRTVAKLTHPDKVDHRTHLYHDATEAYEKGDLIQLLVVAKKCGMDYPVTDEVLALVARRAKEIQQESQFLEATLAWQWYYAPDENTKNDYLSRYVVAQLGY